MKSCARPKLCSGSLRHRITVERRTMLAPVPGSAEAAYTYVAAHNARAEILTKGGVSEFNRVVIDGTQVTHTITMRHTTTPIDIRDRVRDASGNLYAILRVENVNEIGDFLKLYCARQGAADRRAIQ